MSSVNEMFMNVTLSLYSDVTLTYPAGGNLQAYGHDFSYRVNLGTADELALDMIINAFSTFSKE